VTSIFTALFIGILATSKTGPVEEDKLNNTLKRVTNSLISFFLLLFLATYIFTLAILISHLKKRYNHFYRQQRCKMWMCAASLIITLTAKIILRMLSFNQAFADWLSYNY
jgi:hypothetical protein